MKEDRLVSAGMFTGPPLMGAMPICSWSSEGLMECAVKGPAFEQALASSSTCPQQLDQENHLRPPSGLSVGINWAVGEEFIGNH